MILKRLYTRLIGHSLRAKVTLGILIPLLVVLGLLSTIEYAQHRREVLRTLSLLASQSGKVIENNLRSAMLESDFSEVQTLLDAVGETGEFRVVYLIDRSGKVIFAPHGEGAGKVLSNQAPDCLPCHSLPPGDRPKSVVVEAEDGQRVFRSMYPIRNSSECSVCHDPAQPLIGLLLTDIPFSPVEASLAADLRSSLMWWLATILATVLIVNLALSQIVIRRLAGLVRALEAFNPAHTNLRLPVDSPDEIGKLTSAFNEMEERIEDEASAVQRLSNHLQQQSEQRGELLKRLITAQEDERKRVARELHDDLGQSLGALAFQMEAIERMIQSNPQLAVDQIEQAQALVTDATDRMYEMILTLRPSALDDLGLAAALRLHAQRYLEGSGIRYELSTDGLVGRLQPEMETALYRIFQEALSNVRHHAQASHVRIAFWVHDHIVESEIEDNGRGFDLNSVDQSGEDIQGLGLLGMRERVHQFGGQIEIDSEPGRGTRIHIRLPLTETAHD